jgi:hypothetical protein
MGKQSFKLFLGMLAMLGGLMSCLVRGEEGIYPHNQEVKESVTNRNGYRGGARTSKEV